MFCAIFIKGYTAKNKINLFSNSSNHHKLTFITSKENLSKILTIKTD